MGKNKKKVSTNETEINNNSLQEDNLKEEHSLESLAINDDGRKTSSEKSTSTADFNKFMAEYRSIMQQKLPEESKNQAADSDEDDGQEEFLKEIPKKQSKAKRDAKLKTKPVEKENKDWDDAITLEPEKYNDPLEKEKILHDDMPDDYFEPNFDLGERKESDADKFQMTFDFDSESSAPEEEKEEKSFEYNPDKPRAIDWVFDLAEMFVFVLLAVMILTSFVFKHSVVEGESMQNTLQDGDHLIISDLFYTPKRGDIVVFEDYSTLLKKAVVKRVIGLPGETVEVRLGPTGEYEVYINGEFLEEEYAYNDIQFTTLGVGKWTVEEGEIFVMGDNRYNSTDSRDSRVGPVKIDSILGKVLFRFYPFDQFGKVE